MEAFDTKLSQDCSRTELKPYWDKAKEEVYLKINISRKSARTVAYLGIFVPSMIAVFVFLSIFFPILFTSPFGPLFYGVSGGEEMLEITSKDAIDGNISWTLIGIVFGIELACQFWMSCVLLTSTLTDVNTNARQDHTRTWLMTNAFLALLDICYFCKPFWFIIGSILILLRGFFTLIVVIYKDNLGTQIYLAEHEDDFKAMFKTDTESPEPLKPFAGVVSINVEDE